MIERGPLIGSGRDADIYDLGDGKVLRVARNGRSLAAEAAVMAHAHAHGAPVPAVHGVTGDGAVVMDRLSGPSMLEHLRVRPWQVRAAARTLVRLHDADHQVPAPAGLASVGLPGDRLVHLDLHPMNVIMTADGPTLIDWSNARSGPPAADHAMTWILLATGEIEAPAPLRAALNVLRPLLVRRFLGAYGRDAVKAALPVIVDRKLADPNLTPAEAERIHALLRRANAVDSPG